MRNDLPRVLYDAASHCVFGFISEGRHVGPGIELLLNVLLLSLTTFFITSFDFSLRGFSFGIFVSGFITFMMVI
jgi:hypothetical protein